jgi:hypothetical protein
MTDESGSAGVGEKVKPPVVVDASKLDWLECEHCPGVITLEGAGVFHSVPPCEEFLRLAAEAGIELGLVKDVSVS